MVRIIPLLAKRKTRFIRRAFTLAFRDWDEITPSAYGEWVDVDISEKIPSKAKGVVLYIVNITGTYRVVKLRKNGVTEDIDLRLSNEYFVYRFVGLDENRLFEVYLQDAYVKMYLVAWTDESVVLRDEFLDVSPTVGDWTDIDVSAEVSADATGVICLLKGAVGLSYNAGIRAKDSTQTLSYGYVPLNGHFLQFAKLNSDKIFQANRANAQVIIYLVGYFKPPVSLFQDAIDVTPTLITWEDINVSANVAGKPVAVLASLKADGRQWAAIRKRGSANSCPEFCNTIGNTCYVGCVVGIDRNRVFQGSRETSGVTFNLNGYFGGAR